MPAEARRELESVIRRASQAHNLYWQRGAQRKRAVIAPRENANSLTECSTGAKPGARDRNKLKERRAAPTDTATAIQLRARGTATQKTTQLSA